MIRNLITSTIASVMLLPSAAFAQSAPGVAYRAFNTPYGVFGCMQRGENKLYSIGATNVFRSGQSVFGNMGSTRIAVWCRGVEGVVFTAGPNSEALRDEVWVAF